MSGAVSPIAAAVSRALQSAPDRIALVDEWRSYSAGEVLESVDAVAQALSGRGREQIRVMMIAPNCAESVILWLATMAVGGLWGSVNPRYAEPERRALAERFGPDMLVTVDDIGIGGAVRIVPGEGLAELGTTANAEPPLTVDPGSPAAVGFTSGTSGRPRGVLHSQAGLLLAAEANLLADKPSGPIGVMLSTMVLNVMVLGPLQGLLAGRTVVLANRTDGEYLARWCADHQIAEIGVPPTVIHDLLDQYDLTGDPRMLPERVETGGAACTAELQRRFHDATGRRVIRGYGLTEAPATVAMSEPGQPFAADSSGVALPHVTLTIRDSDGAIQPVGVDGEICISAATSGPLAHRYPVMLGYLDDSDPAPVRDGVLYTGDIGRLDGSGRLFVTGRRSAMIIRGGANISPAEVEDVLVGHPAVTDAAVFGVPDQRLGEVAAAAVCVAAGRDLDIEDLRAYVARFLSRYKVPAFVLTLDVIPRNPTGKPDREALLREWRKGSRGV